MLAIGVATSAALSIALWAWRNSIGYIAFAITAFVALTGFWVTGSHLDEWRGQLRVSRK